MVNSRRKGAEAEVEFAHYLTDRGFAASRGQQFHGSPDSPDVLCPTLPAIHWEVKRVQAFNAYKALDQATNDCGGKIPVVAHRRNKREWIAILPMHSLIELFTERAQEKSESD